MPEKTEGADFVVPAQTMAQVAKEARAASDLGRVPGVMDSAGKIFKRRESLTGPETKLRALKWFLACVTLAFLGVLIRAPNAAATVFGEWTNTVALVSGAFMGVQYLQRKDGIGGEK
jgi:hypothetical protein